MNKIFKNIVFLHFYIKENTDNTINMQLKSFTIRYLEFKVCAYIQTNSLIRLYWI